MFPTPIARTTAATRAAYAIMLVLCLAVWLLPLIAVALTSIRSLDDLNRGNLWGWPTELRWDNYAAVLSDSRMGRFIVNSFVITLPSVVGAVGLACLAGFALAKYRFRGNLALLVMFVAGNLVPAQVLMIPVRDLMMNRLGIYDTHWALIVFHVAFQTGFCTLFMRNFIKQLPDALLESARMDGVGELAILWHVVLPMMRPAIAALGALTFTFVWNDYFWALVLVQSDDVRPVTAGVQSLRGMWSASWQLISASSIIAAVPPMIVFFVMQKEFVAGLAGMTAQELGRPRSPG